MNIADELEAIFLSYGGLDPERVVEWARGNPESALYNRFDWNDSTAAHKFRLQQARKIIVEVEVIYPDSKIRQVYVSPLSSRGNGGYTTLVSVMSNAEKRAEFLAQALAEYERIGKKYQDLEELAGIRQAVTEAHEVP